LEQAARFEEIKIQLPEPIQGLDAITAVVGIPEWWPTGARIAVALAHDSGGDLNNPVVERVHRRLTQHKCLSVRFNFPFAESGRPSSEDSAEVLERAFRAALSILGRDATAAPSHLFLGGMGIGGRVAARLATARLQIDGLFFLGYPLHPAGDPARAKPDHLNRIIAPMLFVQGSEDSRCDLDALRGLLGRIGAPTTLQSIRGADHTLLSRNLPAEGGVDEGDLAASAVATWIDKVLQIP